MDDCQPDISVKIQVNIVGYNYVFYVFSQRYVKEF